MPEQIELKLLQYYFRWGERDIAMLIFIPLSLGKVIIKLLDINVHKLK